MKLKIERENKTSQYNNAREYVAERLKLESGIEFLEFQDRRFAMEGLFDGIHGCRRNLWTIRNYHLELYHEGKQTLEQAERKIAKHQKIYGITHSWGEKDFLEEHPQLTKRKSIKVA